MTAVDKPIAQEDAASGATRPDLRRPAFRTEPSRLTGWLAAVALVVGFFLVGAAQLSRLEFSGGSEQIVAATVLEIKRDHNWWVPTLRGRPRLVKPPLTAWIAAAAVSDDTLRNLDNPDPGLRRQAYRDLSWQIRWPSLLAASLTLLAAFEAGRVIFGVRIALAGMVVTATTLLMMRFGLTATTDVMLTLWVAVVHVGLLHAVLRGRRWAGCTVAGLALGLAMMSKGPVALVFTLLPFGGVAVAAWWNGGLRVREWAGPVCAMVAGLALVGLPWYADQLRVQGWPLVQAWRVEVLREGATDLPRDPVWSYLSLFPMMMPWIVFMVAGLVAALRERRELPRMFWVAAAIVWPIVVITLFKDKNERYLLPLAPVCGVLTGFVIARSYAVTLANWERTVRAAGMAVPWLMAAGLAVMGAVGGEWGRKLSLVRIDGGPWFTWPLTAAFVMALGLMCAAGLLLHRRLWYSNFAAAATATLLTGALFLHGYSRSENGAAPYLPVAERLRIDYPGRPVYELWDTSIRSGHDLNIYLNRVLPGIESIAAATEPNAVVLLLRRTSSAAPEVPAGWTLAEVLRAGKRKVYVLQR